jgi:hypothetical protein
MKGQRKRAANSPIGTPQKIDIGENFTAKKLGFLDAIIRLEPQSKRSILRETAPEIAELWQKLQVRR